MSNYITMHYGYLMYTSHCFSTHTATCYRQRLLSHSSEQSAVPFSVAGPHMCMRMAWMCIVIAMM